MIFFHRTFTQLRKLFRFMIYLMNNIFLRNFERLQKKTWLLIKYIISFLLCV